MSETIPGAGGKGNLGALPVTIVTRPTPSFIEFAFGREFADRLDAIEPACPEPRPTAGFGFEPDPRAAAFWAGFTLGLDREDAAPPAHFGPREARSFRGGLAAGRREWDRRLDEMFADRAADGRVTDLDVYRNGGVS